MLVRYLWLNVVVGVQSKLPYNASAIHGEWMLTAKTPASSKYKRRDNTWRAFISLPFLARINSSISIGR